MKRYITLVKSGKRVLLLCLVSPLWLCDIAAAQLPPAAQSPPHNPNAKNQAPLGQVPSSQAPTDSREKVYGYEVQRDAYLKEAREQITELKNKIDALKVKAKKSRATVKARMEKEIQGFERDLHEVDKTWGDLKASGANTWEDVKSSLESSIKKLRAAIDGTSN